MTGTAAMNQIFVFAGLGSNSLFSRQVLNTAIGDSATVEAQVLLEACHAIFVAALTSSDQEQAFTTDIDLEDFKTPQSLINPPAQYHKNSTIQHVFLYLIQLLRYIKFSTKNQGSPLGIAGFCAGMLPSAVISTSRTPTELLSRGRDFFHVALYLGIRSASNKQTMVRNQACSPNLPWSVIVDELSAQQAQVLLEESIKKSLNTYIYVSAINSSSCVTLSGRGNDLARFVKEILPSRYRVRATNIFCLYHDRRSLAGVQEEVLRDLRQHESLFSATVQLFSPLFSTIDGELINISGHSTFGEFCVSILEMILLHPVDWTAVQENVFNIAAASTTEIVNFGPGYGISRPRNGAPGGIKVIDASASKQGSSLECPSELTPSDTIAIVGMGLDLPGAIDTQTLWKNLMDGLNSCTEIPSSRFHVEDFYQKNTGRKLTTKYGNFMDNPFLFDNELFKISPREAKSIDPQQRVMLQTAYRALEDAGYVPDSTPSFSRKTFGCYIGNATIDYTNNVKDNIDVYYSPGTLRAFQSGRISYAFQWTGPSLTLDTACSSSMVAIHQASRALLSGDCRAALVGGINVITSPDMYLGLDRGHFLSPTGQCKPFDDSADGYCRSEGCVAFVLKKLDDAISEGDHILGVIRGIEVNQSGNSHSITHPHAPTQEELFGTLLKKSKIHPHQITVAETHGTGTQAGDPNEMIGIRKVFCEDRAPSNLLHFTSIKANIGHAEAASGVASMAKVLLMMKHGEIPPQISLKRLNHKIKELGTDGAVISRDGVSWPRPSTHSRLALINNFGAAGSNSAMILQEYHNPVYEDEYKQQDHGHAYLFGFSAKSETALLQYRDAFLTHLHETSGPVSIRDLAYSSTARRQIFGYRIAVTGSSAQELVDNLKTSQLHNVRESENPKPCAVFAFSGQGSQYLGMGREMLVAYPEFKKTAMKCEQWLLRNGYPGCFEIFESLGGSVEPSATLYVQTATFVLQVSLARLLISIGITPTLLVGHSLGEYAALVIAGVLDLQSALSLVALREKLIKELCKQGETSMLAVNVSTESIKDEVESNVELRDLTISCDNGPSDCVAGGPIAQLQNLKTILSKKGFKSKLLDVPMAYHTVAMDPILDRLTKFAKTIELSSPSFPVLSNVFGRLILPGENAFTHEYFATHARQTVALNKGMHDLHSHGLCAETSKWVEIGPHPTLLPMLSTNLDRNTTTFLPSLRKGTSDSKSFAQLLSHFYLNCTGLNWRNAFDKRAILEPLPAMPFIQQEFVFNYPHENARKEEAVDSQEDDTRTMYPFLSKIIQPLSKTSNQAIFETSIAVFKEYIVGHLVCGFALCPASVYHEIAICSAKQLDLNSGPIQEVWTLSKVNYVAPLLYFDGSCTIVRITMTPIDQARTNFSFKISSGSTDAHSQRQTIHCQGQVKMRLPATQKHAKLLEITKRKKSLFSRSGQGETRQIFQRRAMYEQLFTRVVSYSEMYQMVKCIWIDGNDSIAVCQYPNTSAKDTSRRDVILMDVLLHVAGFVANLNVENDEVCICTQVTTATLSRNSYPADGTFEVYCSNFELENDSLIISDAYATDSQGIVAIFKGMTFQRMKLNRMTQAMQLAHKKSGGSNISSVEIGFGNPKPTDSAPHFPSPKASEKIQLSVRDIIAKTSNIEASKLTTDTTLQEIGFDSLLMIELSSNLSTHKYGSIDGISLSEEATVGDIEKACTDESEPASKTETTGSEISPTSLTPASIVTDIASIIAETCGAEADSVTSEVELEALGIDSLLIIELETRLQGIWASDNAVDISGCRTVGDVERLADLDNMKQVESRLGEGVQQALRAYDIPEPPNLAPKKEHLSAETKIKITSMLRLKYHPETVYRARESNKSAPLFLIHDGSGLCLQYHRIRHLDRTTYAIHDPKFLESHSWPKMSDMSLAYAELIEKTNSGPIVLGGWSFGGVVAFEAAKVLMAKGHPVLGVVLIDSPPPINHEPLSATIIDAVAKTGGTSGSVGDTIRSLVHQSFVSCTSLLEKFQPKLTTNSTIPVPRVFLLRSSDDFHLGTGDDGGELENTWLQDRSDPQTSIEGWERVINGKVLHVDIPGNHFEVFDVKNIEAVSKALAHACHELESPS